ncbi:MAG: AAA family ATPase [Candidatus Thorarchaeota archaeon]
MKLIRLELQNFKPFRHLSLPENDDELPNGLIIIRGPNSTGKSSLFEAILWALWGPTSVGLTNDELISFASSFCRVKMVFEIAGIRYEIDRSYDPANGMSVVLSHYRDEAWKRIADKSQTVGRTVDEILSLDSGQALNTLLVRQGEVANIAHATPSVLRELLVKVYNIELLGQMTRQLENLESDLSNQIGVLQEEYRPPEDIREQIADAKSRIGQDEAELKTIDNEKIAAENLLSKLPEPKDIKIAIELFDEIRRKESEHDQSLKRRDKELKAAGLVDADARIISARLDSLKKESTRLESEKQTLMDQSSQSEREIGTYSGVVNDLQEKVTTLSSSSSSDEEQETVCPTCQKPLTESERKNLIKEYSSLVSSHRAKIRELEAARDEIPSQIREIEDRLKAIPRAIDAVTRVAEQHQESEGMAAEVEEVARKLGKVLQKMDVDSVQMLLKKHKVTDLNELQNSITKLTTTLISLRTRSESAAKRIERDSEQVKDLQEKEVKMKEMGARIKTLEDLREHTRYVRRKLVSGFIADYVFQKRLIGIIRKATNQYVSSFTNGQYTSIDLEPTPPKGRSGPGLLLKIWDERDKAHKKTSQLSFGDRTAISLGLRLGISRTMSSIRPFKESPAVIPRIRSVLLDEPLGGLDRDRRLAVVRNLVDEESFEQIFLITHTDVRGWEGVPVVEVSKSGTSSTAVLSLQPDT